MDNDMGVILFKRGLYFVRPVVYVTFICAFLSLFVVFDYPLIAIGSIAACLSVGLTTWGVEMNLESKEIRGYVRVLGVKVGKWKSFEAYSDLAILRRKIGRKSYSAQGQTPINETNVKYSLNLLDTTHRQKIELDQYNSMQEAEEKLQRLSVISGLRATTYSPPISAATLRKRR